jgi:hypothetical protein
MHQNSSTSRCTKCGHHYYCNHMDGDLQPVSQRDRPEQNHVCPECLALSSPDAEINRLPTAHRFLQQHEPLSQRLPEPPLQTLHAALAGPCLFYPGAGRDIDPALLFANSGAVSTVVYADYSAGFQCRARAVFHGFEHPTFRPSGWKKMEEGYLQAGDFGFLSPDAYHPSTYRRNYSGSPEDAMRIGAWARFSGWRGQVLSFFYFFTEAIQTYLNLWGINGRAPLAIVVQNHGLGGLWTRLDGDCLLYAAAQRLPKYLYVGDIGSEPWPGYRRVSEDQIDLNSMYQSKRALFRAEAEDPLNPHSPLNTWDGRSESIHSDRYPKFHVLKITRPSIPGDDR